MAGIVPDGAGTGRAESGIFAAHSGLPGAIELLPGKKGQ
jgi:hypothetical protein